MPDADGNEQGDATETPLHAYKDQREEEIEPGSRGADGNTPTPEPGAEERSSYQHGGHASDTESDSRTAAPAAAGTVEDDSSGGYGGEGEPERSPDRSASANAERAPRGTDRPN